MLFNSDEEFCASLLVVFSPGLLDGADFMVKAFSCVSSLLHVVLVLVNTGFEDTDLDQVVLFDEQVLFSCETSNSRSVFSIFSLDETELGEDVKALSLEEFDIIRSSVNSGIVVLAHGVVSSLELLSHRHESLGVSTIAIPALFKNCHLFSDVSEILVLLVSASFITVHVSFDFSVDVIVSLLVSFALSNHSVFGFPDVLFQFFETSVTVGNPFELECAVTDSDSEHLNANEVTVLFELSLTIFDSREVGGADLAENRVFSSFTDGLDGLVSSSIELSVSVVDLHLGGNPFSSVVVGVSDLLFSIGVVSADNVSHLHALSESCLTSSNGSLNLTLGLIEALESSVNGGLESSAP